MTDSEIVGVANTPQCSICREGLEKWMSELLRGKVVKFGCGHIFHEECASRWNLSCHHNQCPTSCPNCRQTVRGATGETLEGSEAVPISVESVESHEGSEEVPIQID